MKQKTHLGIIVDIDAIDHNINQVQLAQLNTKLSKRMQLTLDEMLLDFRVLKSDLIKMRQYGNSQQEKVILNELNRTCRMGIGIPGLKLISCQSRKTLGKGLLDLIAKI